MGVSFCLLNGQLQEARAAIGESPSATATPTTVDDQRLKELIAQLGSEDFYLRQRASQQIQSIGVQAFDALAAVETHPDPEVAARARAILARIPVEFVDPRDPPAVRKLLEGYERLSAAERETMLIRLADLPDNQGAGALARIARFDASPYIARLAALRILRGVTVNAADRQARTELIERELGTSSRDPVTWLRDDAAFQPFSASAEELRAHGARWRATAQTEQARIGAASISADPGITTPQVVLELRRHAGELFAQVLTSDPGSREQLLAVSREMIADADDSVPSILGLLGWIKLRNAPELLPPLVERFQQPLESHPLLACVYAARLAQFGETELAKKAATKAEEVRQFTPAELGYYPRERDLPVIYLAYRLEKEGCRDAAREEYRKLIETVPAGEYEALQARLLLGESLADEGNFTEAAALFEQAATALWDNERQGRRGWGAAGPDPTEVKSRAQYFAALSVKATEPDRYVALLKQSITTDPSNPDGLIELYSWPGNTPPEQARVRTAIRNGLAILRERITLNPGDDGPHNLWAWLAAKTIGNPDQALAESLESLRLSPGSASYLDTAAACFAARQDYVNAVRCQAMAVAADPFAEKLQRRLQGYRESLTAAIRQDAAPAQRKAPQ